MTLKEYLKKEKLTYRAFSQKCGLDHTALFRIANGERGKNLREETIKAITKASKGKVTEEDLINGYLFGEV